MINVTVNNKNYQFETRISLEEVLWYSEISTNGITVAVNEQIIPKQEWVLHKIDTKDAILIIKSTQGG